MEKPTWNDYIEENILEENILMDQVFKLENPILNYAWGSHRSISKILDKPVPSEKPEAEMWMGAHPKAPSMVRINDTLTPIHSLIKASPEVMLGHRIADTFDGELPFLFKILASDKPLSIQAHPNQMQAKKGFEKEDQEKIPIDAPHRNYKDKSHKPECLMAMTPFSMVYGFRSAPDIMALTDTYNLLFPKEFKTILNQDPLEKPLKKLFTYLMTRSLSEKKRVIQNTMVRAKEIMDESPVFNWIVKLYEHYPEDIGILSPLFLNVITLSPGEAVFVPAGALHSYLNGTGVELMANSDNVLRGGLTSKHIDLEALISILNFDPLKYKVFLPETVSPFEKRYTSSVLEFSLSILTVTRQMNCPQKDRNVPEILLCEDGEASFFIEDEVLISLKKGDSLFVPAKTMHYTLKGEATLYRASVNKDMLP